jgi:eukaryotic-like serine/threonine-protein kinase
MPRRLAEEPPLMLPARIGRYDISAELGRGATSIVYKGVDPASGRVMAVKVLQRSGDDTDGDAEAILLRFRQEARTVGRLRHPGVVEVQEFGEDGLHSWIAMEYVDGSNLDDLLVRNPLPGPARALALMDDLLDALGCVHREGICHRDVKPANIMVTPAGRVKLMDFGVARLRDLGLTRVSAIVGTPAFMAPEQFTGGALDHRADLFACGALLYLLLGGRRPFTGAPAAVMHQILHEEPPPVSQAAGGAVGRAFDEVVARALAKRPEDRFASADDMRDALRTAAARLPESPLATVVGTMVGTVVGTAAPDAGLRASAEDEVMIQPIVRMAVGDVRRQARLVDPTALYTAGADEGLASLDGVPHRDTDAAHATSLSVDVSPQRTEPGR